MSGTSTTARVVLACNRCGHEWLRRNLTKLPANCAKCNSPYWDKPRKFTRLAMAQRSKEDVQI